MAECSYASECVDPNKLFLNKEQISEFLQNGVLVVENVLNAKQISEAHSGLSRTLRLYGVDTNDLATTGHALQTLSSTNGSGGVLDVFYPGWKMDIATNPRLFHVTCQLWEAAHCHKGETREELGEEHIFKWHPYGAFDCQQGFIYIDRIGYRLPTTMAQKIASDVSDKDRCYWGNKKDKPLQRCLTPHLDCCPENLFSDKSKWRPIQCFVSLTDNLEKNTGGFEAATGFHKDFDKWARSRQPTTITKKVHGKPETVSFPAPCIGEYTHIRPKEDQEVMNRIQHIAVKAGSAVFWDNRIPHANAYRNDGDRPRSVVYCSFLPIVKLNQEYVSNQLVNWKRRRPPTDQWINISAKDTTPFAGTVELEDNLQYQFSELGRKLMGIDPW